MSAPHAVLEPVDRWTPIDGWTLLAVAAAATAAALAVRPRRLIDWTPPSVRVAVPVIAAGVASALLDGGWLVPALLLVVVVAVVLRARRRVTERRQAVRCRGQVLEACDGLAAELSAGLDPGSALVRAAREWSFLEPVAQADRLGGDVPTALREVARRPGAEDLVAVAAAWQVALRSGHGLAPAISRIADALRATAATRRIVISELASARATARLVALLPLAALAMGSGIGGDPWTFLLRTPAGWACLVVGLGLGGAGLWWIEQIAHDVERST